MHILVLGFVLIIVLIALVFVAICALIGGIAYGIARVAGAPDPIPAIVGAVTFVVALTAVLMSDPFGFSGSARDGMRRAGGAAVVPRDPAPLSHFVTQPVSVRRSNMAFSGDSLSAGDCVAVLGSTDSGLTRIEIDLTTYLIDNAGLRELQPGQACPVEFVTDVANPEPEPYHGTVSSAVYVRTSPSSDFESAGWSVQAGECLRIINSIDDRWVRVLRGWQSGYLSAGLIGDRCQPPGE